MFGISRRELIVPAGVGDLELEDRGGTSLRLSDGRKGGDQEGRDQERRQKSRMAKAVSA